MRSFIILIFLSSLNIAYTQCDNVHIVPVKEYIVCGMNSYFSIKHCFTDAILANDVKVFEYNFNFDSLASDHEIKLNEIKVEKRGDFYKINVEKPGLIEIKVKINGIECSTKIDVQPLPAEVGLGTYNIESSGKISIGQFKSNLGILAQIVNFDIYGKCLVKEFELVRVPRHDLPSRHLNLSGRFDAQSRSIINETKGGDIYLFRNILIKCPGDENTRKVEDISFEIAESIFKIDSTYYPSGYKIMETVDVGNGDTITLDQLTGKYEIRSKAGITISEGNYSAKYGCNPGKNGTWIERYRNGRIKTIGSYLNEKKMNTWTYFSVNGTLDKIENYSIPYPNKSHSQIPMRHGSYVEYHKNGTEKLRGEYDIVEKYYPTDTSYMINYDTYEETPKINKGDFWKPISVKTGRWIYFDQTGKLVIIKKELPNIGNKLRYIK